MLRQLRSKTCLSTLGQQLLIRRYRPARSIPNASTSALGSRKCVSRLKFSGFIKLETLTLVRAVAALVDPSSWRSWRWVTRHTHQASHAPGASFLWVPSHACYFRQGAKQHGCMCWNIFQRSEPGAYAFCLVLECMQKAQQKQAVLQRPVFMHPFFRTHTASCACGVSDRFIAQCGLARVLHRPCKRPASLLSHHPYRKPASGCLHLTGTNGLRGLCVSTLTPGYLLTSPVIWCHQRSRAAAPSQCHAAQSVL